MEQTKSARNLVQDQSQRILMQLRAVKISAILIAISSLSMGNKGCEESSSERVLKMEVEIGALNARKITMPTGEVIDFPYVVNSLFYRQVMNNNHFVIANPVPSPNSLIAASSGSYSQNKSLEMKIEQGTASIGDGSISLRDENVLKSYGFMNSIRRKAAIQAKATAGDATAITQAAKEESKLPVCLYDMPQAQLGGEVISFEATWGIGVGVGYGNNGIPIGGNVGGNVDFSQSKLELGLRTDDPLTLNTVAIADGIAHQSKVKFGIDFTAGLPIGLNFFFNTPLSDVIRKAMDRGLDAIVQRYKTLLSLNMDWNEVWESRVIYDPEIVDGDTHIAFRGGYRAGMMVGDKLTATNLHYTWEGAACYTRLKYKIPLTATPVAELEVVSVGDNIAVARVTKYMIEQKILPGAQIRVLQLKQPPKQTTKGSAKLSAKSSVQPSAQPSR
jgi:hypothetical protein